MSSSVRAVVAVVLAGALAGLAGCSSDLRGDRVPAADEVETNARDFGIAGDPWQVDDWADVVGAMPTMVMEFEPWHRNRTLDSHFAQTRRLGLSSFMVTWEPWAPVPPYLGDEARYAAQPRYRNEAIADGELDDYIREFAASVAASGLTVYIRHAHEMNGDWYPWSREPENYVRAWRRIVDIFREEGAVNARFVYSLNPSLYLDPADWLATAEQYWPGDDYVDLLGSTMISFGGTKDYAVADFVERLELMHEEFGKDVILSEVNTDAQGRVEWLTDLRTWLATEAPWVDGVVLSQEESRGQVLLGNQVGDMSWSVASDPQTQPVVRGMIEDLRQAP